MSITQTFVPKKIKGFGIGLVIIPKTKQTNKQNKQNKTQNSKIFIPKPKTQKFLYPNPKPKNFYTQTQNPIHENFWVQTSAITKEKIFFLIYVDFMLILC